MYFLEGLVASYIPIPLRKPSISQLDGGLRRAALPFLLDLPQRHLLLETKDREKTGRSPRRASKSQPASCRCKSLPNLRRRCRAGVEGCGAGGPGESRTKERTGTKPGVGSVALNVREKMARLSMRGRADGRGAGESSRSDLRQDRQEHLPLRTPPPYERKRRKGRHERRKSTNPASPKSRLSKPLASLSLSLSHSFHFLSLLPPSHHHWKPWHQHSLPPHPRQ